MNTIKNIRKEFDEKFPDGNVVGKFMTQVFGQRTDIKNQLPRWWFVGKCWFCGNKVLWNENYSKLIEQKKFIHDECLEAWKIMKNEHGETII